MEPFELFGLRVYPFGLGVALASALALLWGTLRARRAGVRDGVMSLFALLAVPLCFVLARLCFVLCEFEYYLSDGFTFFLEQLCDVTSGGFMLPGLLLGGVLAGFLACRIGHERPGRLADAMAAPACLLLALIHLTEGACGTGYGWGLEDWFAEGEGYSVFVLADNSFFCRFPFAVQDYYEEWKWAVFLLMALVMLALCLITLRARTGRDGGRFALFLLMLGAAMIAGESLRQDSVVKWGFVRVNQLAGITLIVVMMVLNWRMTREKAGSLCAAFGLSLLCSLAVIAMEFAMEGKISAIEWLPMDMCYVITCLSCLGLVLVNLPLWRRAWGSAKENKQ